MQIRRWLDGCSCRVGTRIALGPLLTAIGLCPAQDINFAQVLEAQGRLSEARVLYVEALRQPPLNLGAYGRLKALSFRLQQFGELAAFTDTLLLQNPDQADLLAGKGEALIRLGEKPAGRDILDRLVQRQPESARLVGSVYEGLGMAREAIDTYRAYRKLKQNPNIFAPQLVDLYEQVGDLPAAGREAVMLLNVDPRLAPAYEQKFRSYAAKASHAALLDVLRGIRDRQVRTEMTVKVLLAAGRDREALEQIAGLESQPRSLEFARFAESSGYLGAAIELYARLGMDFDRARVLSRAGRVDEAVALLANSTEPDAVYEYAELLRLVRRDLSRAARSYEQVVRLQPGRETAILGWAECLIGLDRLADADRVLLSLPTMTETGLYLRARIAFFEERFDSCTAYARQLAVRNPQGPLVNDALEMALAIVRGGPGLARYVSASRDLATGQPDSALQSGLDIVRTDTAWAGAAYLLVAECYRQKNEPNQALAALEELEERLTGSPARARARYFRALILGEDLKNDADYRKLMTSVYVDFPDSPYAALARNRLIPTSKPRE